MTEKPILLLDMDGPLAAFDKALWEVCKTLHFKLNIKNLSDKNRKYYMTENIIDPEQAYTVRQIINRTDFFRNLPVTEGSKDGVEELKKHFDIWICTKPLDDNTYCRHDKMQWISENFPSLYDKVIMAPKKHLVTGNILLDDAPDVGYLNKALWTPIVFSEAFNGSNSVWKDLAHWKWGDPVDSLIYAAEENRKKNKGLYEN